MKPTEKLDFMREGLTLVSLFGKLDEGQKRLAAAAVAEVAGVTSHELVAAAAALRSGMLERGDLGKARLLFHLVKGQILAAAQEFIRHGVHGAGAKSGLTFPNRLSAEYGVRKAIMGKLWPPAPEPKVERPKPSKAKPEAPASATVADATKEPEKPKA